MNIHDLQLHFSIRKLSVGVVSCLIGICFISSNQTVQADSMSIASNNKSVIISNSSSNSNPTETKSSNKQDIVDSNNTSPTQIDSHSNQNSTKSNPTETIASKSNNKQNIVDSNNTSPTQINSHSNQNSTKTILVNFKLNVSSQQPVAADSAENKLETAALNLTIDEKLDAKMLAESKITAQAKDTNGGFDASWGKLDVNNWKGSVQGDCYQLTDYTGDANHVIVPNEADFAKARISTSGKQVGVTSALMHTIFKKANTNDATVAFSKTNNETVKAIGSDWSDTWGHSQSGDSKAKLSKFDGTNLDVSNVTDMHYMFHNNQISDLSSLTNWNVGQVTDMSHMFDSNHISDLSPLAKWKVDIVKDMSHMFDSNHISDLSPLANWKVYNVIDMSWMFYSNHISDLSPLASPLLANNWNGRVYNVKDIRYMFDNNSSIEETSTERVINFVYPAGYTGKKQYSVTQTVYVQRNVGVKLTTKDSKPSNNILDWVTTSEPSYSDWSVEANKSTTTVDGQNDTSLVPYVIKNGKIMFASYELPHISGYKAVLIKNSPANSLFMPSFLSFTYVPLNDSKAQKPADKPVDLKDNQGKPSASPAPTVPVNPAPIVSDQGKENQPVSTPVNDPVVPEEPIAVAGQNDEKSDVSHLQDIASKKQDNTKPGKKVHVSPISDHDSGANKKNSKITNAAASALADKPNRNTPVGNANDEANKTNRTVQAAVVNNDKNVLPQTGESQNKTGIIGMAFASLAGMFGLAGTKKKRKND